MAIATATLTSVAAYLAENNAPVEYVDAIRELIAQRENRSAKASAKRAEKSGATQAVIMDAVNAIVEKQVLSNLDIVMNSDVRVALANEGVEKASVQKATKALALMVDMGYLAETVPPKGVSCRCYRLA